MNLPQQLARDFRAVHFGGNWTAVNLRDQLSDVTWEEATTKVGSLNTIAALTFHINYYIAGVLAVFQGGELQTKDVLSFDLPPIASAEDWEALLHKTWHDAEAFASEVEQLPEADLWETFVEETYGTYYANIQGIIEHTHYHLGQVMLLKKMLHTSAAIQ